MLTPKLKKDKEAWVPPLLIPGIYRLLLPLESLLLHVCRELELASH
jgi:hypothetical protein